MPSFPAPHSWPNGIDVVATGLFLAAILVVPAAGYVFMVLDFRAYLRSLHRGLVKLGHYLPFGEVPAWARQDTPRAIAALGLRMPCTEEDLKQAYRERVKQLHPDHGGDQRRFLLLQAHFEEAMAILAAAAPHDIPSWQSTRPTA